MNKIKIAAELLADRAERTTDATAFIVKIEDDRNSLDLVPDMVRRHNDGRTFFHMETVVDVCRALNLNFWITSEPARDNDLFDTKFRVHIYD